MEKIDLLKNLMREWRTLLIQYNLEVKPIQEFNIIDYNEYEGSNILDVADNICDTADYLSTLTVQMIDDSIRSKLIHRMSETYVVKIDNMITALKDMITKYNDALIEIPLPFPDMPYDTRLDISKLHILHNIASMMQADLKEQCRNYIFSLAMNKPTEIGIHNLVVPMVPNKSTYDIKRLIDPETIKQIEGTISSSVSCINEKIICRFRTILPSVSESDSADTDIKIPWHSEIYNRKFDVKQEDRSNLLTAYNALNKREIVIENKTHLDTLYESYQDSHEVRISKLISYKNKVFTESLKLFYISRLGINN